MTSIETQENLVNELLHKVLNSPTDENKQNYLENLNILEYITLQEAHKYNPKTPEYFAIKKEAFAVRPKFAKSMLSLWVSKFGSSSGCPHKYEDTLNIPFKSIATPQ